MQQQVLSGYRQIQLKKHCPESDFCAYPEALRDDICLKHSWKYYLPAIPEGCIAIGNVLWHALERKYSYFFIVLCVYRGQNNSVTLG